MDSSGDLPLDRCHPLPPLLNKATSLGTENRKAGAVVLDNSSRGLTIIREFSVKLSVNQRKLWEYKSLRFDYKGRGITQEINLLDIDGVRIKGWGDQDVPSLPALLADLGRDGWEMVAHVVNQDNQTNGVTFHYMQFKREIASG